MRAQASELAAAVLRLPERALERGALLELALVAAALEAVVLAQHVAPRLAPLAYVDVRDEHLVRGGLGVGGQKGLRG